MRKPEENNMSVAEKTENGNNSLPFLVNAVALFLIVYGVINFIYYSAVLIYSFINPEFFKDLQYSEFKSNWLILPVSFMILINVIYFVSGILILYKVKKAVTAYYFSFFISVFFSLFFMGNFNFIDFGLGMISIIILVYFRKNLNWK